MNKRIFDDVRSLNQMILIRSILNLVTMLGTKMSFSSSKKVYIVIFNQGLLPFACEIMTISRCVVLSSSNFNWKIYKP